jgi:hypothetical protein
VRRCHPRTQHTWGPLPIICDLAAYEKPIDRLGGLPIRAMFFSHPYRGLRLAPSVIRSGGEVAEYLADSRRMASLMREAVLNEVLTYGAKPLTEVADSIVDALPREMGFLKMAALPAPELSLGTIACALKQAKKS